MLSSVVSKSAMAVEEQKTLQPRKRSVQFPKDVSISQVVLEIANCEDFTEEDKKRLWFARSDYHFSRSTARVIAKESERYGHSKHLDDCYKPTFSEGVQSRLNIWALQGDSRRGLERWASSIHGQKRKDDQYMYIQGVLRAQQEMKFKDCLNEERLREVGHILSRKSRLLAQMMGEADNHAARFEYGMEDINVRISPRAVVKQRKNLGLQQIPPFEAHQQRLHQSLPHLHHHRRPVRRVPETAPHPPGMRRVAPGVAAPAPMMRRASDTPTPPTTMRRPSDTSAPPPRIKIAPTRQLPPARIGRVSRMA